MVIYNAEIVVIIYGEHVCDNHTLWSYRDVETHCTNIGKRHSHSTWSGEIPLLLLC